ncbi:MAG TPA: DEAD/DEAH box helicase [Edaphocola sp.]|nr:DEAD/DEAH box helicase [Edaphocola sp.]
MEQEQLAQILKKIGIKTLNGMQQQSLDAHDNADNIMLLSPTGSGKTLAFLLPLMQKVDAGKRENQVLVVSPTRELAMQIEQVFKNMGTAITITCCYGGHKREIEEHNLSQNPNVIVGTPGRLGDHIRRGNFHPGQIRHLILDEFDKSLELGFQDEIQFIVESLPNLKSRTLASATNANDIDIFPGWEQPVVLDFLTAEKDGSNRFVVQSLRTKGLDKLPDLVRLLCFHGGRQSVIFCNFREDVEMCSQRLAEAGIQNVFYHGAMEQRERDLAMCKFRNGSARFLVTTDLAARGLDFEHIRYVIHYQLPVSEKSFTHRNGRTARMDKSGTAILMLNEKEYLPDYINESEIEEIILEKEQYPLPGRPEWATLYFGMGKKNKVNKIDFVGFLTKIGQLRIEEIGKIEVKDFDAFVAVRRSKAAHLLSLIKGEKIKNKKVRVEFAK